MTPSSPRLAARLPLPPGVKATAVYGSRLRDDGEPAERLLLTWSEEGLFGADRPPLCVIGLNPSSADEHGSDRTLLRDWGFRCRLGFGRLDKNNLFDVRGTDADVLLTDTGSDGNVSYVAEHARRVIAEGGTVLACWGGPYSPSKLQRVVAARAEEVLQALEGVPLHALALSQDGFPRHTLFLPGASVPFLWRP